MGRRACALVWGLVLAPVVAATQQPAAPPEPPKLWEGTAGAGISLSKGNSDTLAYNLAFDVAHTPKARNVVKNAPPTETTKKSDVAFVTAIAAKY